MVKKVLAVVTLAGALSGVAATPALAAGQVCFTSNINVNGTAAPTNGTNCVDLPA